MDLYTTYVQHRLSSEDCDASFTLSPPARMFWQPGLPREGMKDTWAEHVGSVFIVV